MYLTQPDPRRSSHRPLVWAVGLLAIIALLLLAACGGPVSGAGESATATIAITVTATATATQDASNTAATIAMDEFNFKGNTNVTIKVGQAINFDDTKGGPHILVIGTNGTFQAQNGAPPELNSASGITVSGDAKTITFPSAGAYQITCTLHPDMQATVTVR